MPGDSGNHYVAPSTQQIQTWETLLNLLLNNQLLAAADSANTIGYQVIQLTDTFDFPNRIYFILQSNSNNFWGTYVYNPLYCRPLVIQTPHAKRDANTGHQGIHVFRKTESIFFQLNGTHRCNSGNYSSCTGNTTSCASTSEPYRDSDLAHNSNSIFQKTTEVLLNRFSNSHFIQLHGFSKRTTDPYVILSNGTQITPNPDFMLSFKNNLFLEDSLLSFKIAHIDTNWTRLRGFWNTQSRLVNGEINPCINNAQTSQGRFFHVEQERTRLRSNVNGWNKVANALNKTFPCQSTDVKELKHNQSIQVYPNPSNGHFKLLFNANQKQLKLRLLSMKGQIFKEETHTNLAELDLVLEQIKGLYFLEIVLHDGERRVLKLIIN